MLWSVLDGFEDINEAVFAWTKLFNNVAEIHAPIKKRRVRGHRTPWMTSEVSELMKERDFHRKKTYDSKSGYHWNKFRNYRNLVLKGIKKAKSDYYTKLIEESKGNSSKLWSAVEHVLPSKNVLEPINCFERDGVIFTTPQDIASALNNFFMNI